VRKAIAREPAAARDRPEEDPKRRRDERATGMVLPLERLNFAYALRGQAAFRPQQVFDDGRFTYVRLPPSLQEMPALFVLGETGEGELVNYVVRGDVLVAQRVADRFVLRLGRAEVTISRQRAADEWRYTAHPWPDAAVPERAR
jgi:type IV secretion system protein VirB9